MEDKTILKREINIDNRADVELFLHRMFELAHQRLRCEEGSGADSPTGHYELYRVRIRNLLEEIDVDLFV